VRFSPEDVEILAGILEEAPDYLSNIEEQILALEKGQEKELLDSIFRSFHSLKGIAGFVNLVPIVEVCHRAEDLIKELKSGKRTKSPALIDALLEAADFVNRVLHRLREAMAGYSGGVLEVDFEDLGERDVLAKIEQIPRKSRKRKRPRSLSLSSTGPLRRKHCTISWQNLRTTSSRPRRRSLPSSTLQKAKQLARSCGLSTA